MANDFLLLFTSGILPVQSIFKKTADYSLVSTLEGIGELEVDGAVYPLEKGDHFILP